LIIIIEDEMKGWRYEGYRHSLAAKGIHSRYKVPPAWKDVKFYSNKPYVATGVDKKGRLQYIYPPSFVKKAAEKKYARIDKLEKQMPSILTKVKQDVAEQKPEAEAVYTIYKTGFRPGTEKDTLADKQAYGVSTLEPKHIKIKGNEVQFKFIGKKGVYVEKDVTDKLLADIMKRRKNGKQLFPVSDSQMRAYFSGLTDGRYKLKDLRTLRAQRLAKELDGDKKQIAEEVSKELSNTPAVAIKSYVAPELLE
jgi:DNA topoisomerase-1